MAEELAGWIDEHPDFERLAPTPFSTLCFRYRAGAAPDSGHGTQLGEAADDEWAGFNEDLLEAINSSGLTFMSHTRLRGRFALRLPIGNIRTTAADVKETWDLIQEKAVALAGNL